MHLEAAEEHALRVHDVVVGLAAGFIISPIRGSAMTFSLISSRVCPRLVLDPREDDELVVREVDAPRNEVTCRA